MPPVCNPDRRTICGQNLARLLKQSPRVKSQEHFAELMGVDARTVRRWLRDGIDSLTTVRLISDLLDISDTEILL